MKRRVVVTGLGLVTPLGLSVADTWTHLLAGQSGVSTITHFDASLLPTRFCAAVKNFDISPWLSSKDAKKFDTFIHYGIAAASQALTDAGLTINETNAHRMGVAAGSGIGGLPNIEKTAIQLHTAGPRRISPFFIPGTIINMLAGELSILHGLKGPNISIVTACTTGAHNIGFAARMIVYGEADVMLAGGAEMASCAIGIGGFDALRALSTRNDAPEKASRPWDKDRDGFVLGDGAGMLVLEEYEHAKQRGAPIYAELVGFGMSADAYHITSPDPTAQGCSSSMDNALRDAHLNPDEVDYINAHGTSTPVGDEVEIVGVKRSFGPHATQLAMSSTKSMTGHLLGAAGAVEAIFCILALRDQIAPPTINLDNPSAGCDLDLIPHHAKPMKIEVALSNSFGFGGTNGTLIFKKIYPSYLKMRDFR